MTAEKNESNTRCLQKGIPYAPMVHYAATRNEQDVKSEKFQRFYWVYGEELVGLFFG